MGRFSPTVLPERDDPFGEFVGDLGEGVVNYATARRLKKGGEREQERLELAKKGQADNLELQKAQNALEEARWQQSQAQQLARLGVQGIVPEEQSGTRAPVMFGGRKTVIPDLGVGIGQQDVTSFTPNKGSFKVGGGYAYDPGRDVSRVQSQDLADRSIAQKQQEQARQRAALIARGYSEADADLVVQGGIGAEKLGPLAAEGEERDIKRYKATVLARELMEQSGANTRDANNPTGKVNAEGLTPYQAAQLRRQDIQIQEQRDANDLKTADETWKPDPIMNRPRTPADTAHMQEADSIRGAVRKRRAGREYAPLFGGGAPAAPAPQAAGRFAPAQTGPVTGVGRNAPQAPAQGGAKPPARERAEYLRTKGYNKAQIRTQLESEGYALK
jgi:hypothetical protein